MFFVFFDVVKMYLKVDEVDEDVGIVIYLGVVEVIVVEFFNWQVFELEVVMVVVVVVDMVGEVFMVVNFVIQVVILLIFGYFYEYCLDVVVV